MDIRRWGQRSEMVTKMSARVRELGPHLAGWGLAKLGRVEKTSKWSWAGAWRIHPKNNWGETTTKFSGARVWLHWNIQQLCINESYVKIFEFLTAYVFTSKFFGFVLSYFLMKNIKKLKSINLIVWKLWNLNKNYFNFLQAWKLKKLEWSFAIIIKQLKTHSFHEDYIHISKASQCRTDQKKHPDSFLLKKKAQKHEFDFLKDWNASDSTNLIFWSSKI